MEWIEIGTLFLVYIVAMIIEFKTENINPLVWVLGMAAEIVYMVMGIARYSWIESFAAFGIILVLSIIFYTRMEKFAGGGVIKSFIMSALYLGRYTPALIILYLLISFVYANLYVMIKPQKFANAEPGELTVRGMPRVIIAAGLTIGIEYLVSFLM